MGWQTPFCPGEVDLIQPHRVQIVVKKTVPFPFLLFDEVKSIKKYSEVPKAYFIYLKVINELGLFSSAFLLTTALIDLLIEGKIQASLKLRVMLKCLQS